MNNEENNFDLPDLKEKEQPDIEEVTTKTVEEQKPIIEIPQEYYDKLEKEKKEKQEKEEAEKKAYEEKMAAKSSNNKSMLFIILSGIITFVLLICTIKINKYCILAIPAYIVLSTIIKSTKEKKESTAPTSILIGNIIFAIIAFLVSSLTIDESQKLFTYTSVGLVVTAFIGGIVSSIITKILTDKENVKAVQTIGYLIVLGAIVAAPIYTYKKYPNEFNKYVFLVSNEVIADTEDEFIVKTLKNRYGIDFTCGQSENHMDAKKIKTTTRICTDPNGIETLVTSYEYNPTDVQYSIQEDYLDKIYLDTLKEKIKENIKTSITSSNISISFYPKEFCAFVGDCVDNDNYYDTYTKEQDRKTIYDYSRNLNLTKYMNSNEIDFFNQYPFGISITIYGNFINSSVYESNVSSVLNVFNDLKLENNLGYIVILKNNDEFKQTVYQVKGEVSQDKTFKDPTPVS